MALKSADELISASLKTELEGLRRQFDSKAKDNEILREQLMDVLVSNNLLRKKLDNVSAPSSLATAVASPAAAPSSPLPIEDPLAAAVAERRARKDDAIAEKNDKLKTALRQKVQVSDREKHDAGRDSTKAEEWTMPESLGLASPCVARRLGQAAPPAMLGALRAVRNRALLESLFCVPPRKILLLPSKDKA